MTFEPATATARRPGKGSRHSPTHQQDNHAYTTGNRNQTRNHETPANKPGASNAILPSPNHTNPNAAAPQAGSVTAQGE